MQNQFLQEALNEVEELSKNIDSSKSRKSAYKDCVKLFEQLDVDLTQIFGKFKANFDEFLIQPVESKNFDYEFTKRDVSKEEFEINIHTQNPETISKLIDDDTSMTTLHKGKDSVIAVVNAINYDKAVESITNLELRVAEQSVTASL